MAKGARRRCSSTSAGEVVTTVTAVADPNIPDLNLDAEAEAMAEVVGALQHAREWFPKIRGASNRVMVSMHLPRIEAQLDRERKALAHETFKSERRIAAYRAEAIGDALFNALGVPNTAVAFRLRALEDEIAREEAEMQRQAQRERERAIFKDATVQAEKRRGHVAKVSDASLVAEVRTGKHRSISDVARAVGLAVPTCWNRLNALVQRGALGADEVPRGNKGGRPRGGGDRRGD